MAEKDGEKKMAGKRWWEKGSGKYQVSEAGKMELDDEEEDLA